MFSFLLMDLFQILAFLVILHKYPLKDRLDRYLIIIAVGGALAMLSKVVYYYYIAENGLLNTVSSTLCFSAMSHLYIYELLSKKQVSKQAILLHLIPYFFSVLVFFYKLFGHSLGMPAIIRDIGNLVIMEMRTLSLLIYLLLDLFLCWRYHRELRRQIHLINGSILVYFVAHKLFVLSLIVFSKFNGGWGGMATYMGLLSMPLLLSVVVYYRVLLGIGKKVMELEQRVARILSDSSKKDAKYVKSNPGDAKYEQMAVSIDAFMEREKPYLNMSFSMTQFAQHMQISQHELSMVLNHKLHISFYEYVNGYRVAYFISQIHRVIQEEMAVLTLAYESGFSSKSTFNKYFRQITGMSPSEYVKKHANHKGSIPLFTK